MTTYDLSQKSERKRLYADAADRIEAAPFLNKTVFESKFVHDSSGNFLNGSGPLNDSCYCIVGGLRRQAVGEGNYSGGSTDPFTDEEQNLIVNELAAVEDIEIFTHDYQFGTGLATFSPLYRWNDAPERTKAEVVAVLRKAAA